MFNWLWNNNIESNSKIESAKDIKDDLNIDEKNFTEIDFEGVDYLEDEDSGEIYSTSHELVGKWTKDCDGIIWQSEGMKEAHILASDRHSTQSEEGASVDPETQKVSRDELIKKYGEMMKAVDGGGWAEWVRAQEEGAVGDSTKKHKGEVMGKTKNNKILRKSRKSLPQGLRNKVWVNTYGEKYSVHCDCCNLSIINPFNCVWAHILSHADGGDISLKNMKPICNCCNSSMGKKHMDDYKKEIKLS